MILATTFETYFLPAIVLALTGAILGLAISYFSKLFAVKVDDRIQNITEMLPGANCGMCGFPGCNAMATAIVSGKAEPSLCKPGKQEMRDRIKKYLEEYEKEHANK